MSNVQNDKMIAICKEISIKNEKTICYKVEDELKELLVSGNYLCRKQYDGKTMSISAIYVEEVVDFVDELTDVVEIGEDVSFLKTRDDLRFILADEFIRDMEKANIKQMRKMVKESMSSLKYTIDICQYSLDDDRRSYLVNTYYYKPEEFEKRDFAAKRKWIDDVHGVELDLYYEINLRELKKTIIECIEKNDNLTNIDKIAIQSQCIEKLERNFNAIGPKGRARMQMNSYLGIDVERETKELIWGFMSPWELRIEFSFLWSLIKNIISLTYVPAVLLLLENEHKIPIYIMLVVVYLIALVFSDEKQTGKFLVYINRFDKEISYATLYYWGLSLSITFIIFSIQMVIAPKTDFISIIEYLLADVVGSYGVILLVNVILSLLSCAVTLWSATFFYQKKWNDVRKIITKVIITVIFILGCISWFDIMNIKVYFEEEPVEIPWKVFIFMMILLCAMLKMLAIWGDKFVKDEKKESL